MEPIKIQKVIAYIEENLTEELSYHAIAALAAVSEADLQRAFKMITEGHLAHIINWKTSICLKCRCWFCCFSYFIMLLANVLEQCSEWRKRRAFRERDGSSICNFSVMRH